MNPIQLLFSVAEYSVCRMSSKAAEQLCAGRVEEVRLYTVSIFHGCETFDEFDLSIRVESVDQEEDDGDLSLDQSCCDCGLVFEIECEWRGVVV